MNRHSQAEGASNEHGQEEHGKDCDEEVGVEVSSDSWSGVRIRGDWASDLGTSSLLEAENSSLGLGVLESGKDHQCLGRDSGSCRFDLFDNRVKVLELLEVSINQVVYINDGDSYFAIGCRKALLEGFEHASGGQVIICLDVHLSRGGPVHVGLFAQLNEVLCVEAILHSGKASHIALEEFAA